MELRQLQHFVAVAEEMHFTRAARRVNIVQSALSTSIRALEEELATKLFMRNTRQVQLTTAGRVFLDKARLALEAVREARDAVAAVQGLTRGRLAIGTVQSLPAFVDLPALLASFITNSIPASRFASARAMPTTSSTRSGPAPSILPSCR